MNNLIGNGSLQIAVNGNTFEFDNSITSIEYIPVIVSNINSVTQEIYDKLIGYNIKVITDTALCTSTEVDNMKTVLNSISASSYPFIFDILPRETGYTISDCAVDGDVTITRPIDSQDTEIVHIEFISRELYSEVDYV